MCGFFGIFSSDKLKQDKSRFKSLTNSINHRGPDDEGFFFNKNIYLGFKRLSIIDVKNGKQPFESQNQRYVIIFNGEIYNYRKLRHNLIDHNIKLKTNSDTETLVESISYFGLSVVSKFNGMFSFALYDKTESVLYLFRDRLGIKPLYYFHDSKKILFSSEINPLIKSNEFDRKINLNAISSYLSFRFNYGVGNYFENIQTVEPGTYLKIKNNNLEKIRYWNFPSFKNKLAVSENKLIDELSTTIQEVLSEHLVSDVPIGSLLSGGLDSSLLTVLMNELHNKPINTYSASFDDERYDENNHAKIVSNLTKSNHTNIILNSHDYENKLQKLISHTCSPLSIPHEIALNSLFSKIKHTNKVVISGEGADEMFGGYGRVQSSGFDYKKILYVKKKYPFFVQNILLSLLGSENFKWSKYKNQLDHFVDIYKWFGNSEKLNLISDDVKNIIENDKKVKEFWIKEFDNIKEEDVLDKIMILFQKHHLNCLLHRLDIHSMAHSVEARVPFCDHRILEFVSKVPYEYKFRWKSNFSKFRSVFTNSFKFSEKMDISKYLLRKFGDQKLPIEISQKKKLGFPVPLDKWLKGNFLNFSKEILLDDKTTKRGLFKKKQIEKLLNNPEILEYDFWGKKIWMLINIELWSRNFID